MQDLHISRFDRRSDNKVKPLEVRWSDFCAFLTDGHVVAPDKKAVPLFNAARYKSLTEAKDVGSNALIYDQNEQEHYVRRAKLNILELDLLVLDYDGTMSIAEAKERFRKFQYLGYTSYNHLHDGKTEKFRIVMCLTKPIPAGCSLDDYDRVIAGGVWYELIDSLKAFAGPCDPQSFNPNQIYYLPAAPADRLKVAHTWVNDGKPLDWTAFARRPVQQLQTRVPDVSLTGDAPAHSSQVLHANQVLNTQHGPVRVGDVQGKIDGVWCPFHVDKNGTEFVRRVPATGNVFLYCKKCEQTFYMDRAEPDDSSPEESSEQPEFSFDDVFGRVELPRIGKFTDATDRTRVRKQLTRIMDKIRRARKRSDPRGASRRPPKWASHVLYLPEGAGKSYLAMDLASKGEKIVFACKSWNQAFEKFETFRREGAKRGLMTRLFLSKDGKARRLFGVPVVRRQPRSPYTTGIIDEEESIQRFIEGKPRLNEALIRLTWQFMSTDRLGPRDLYHASDASQSDDKMDGEAGDAFNAEDEGEYDESEIDVSENAHIIVTTFAQLRILRLKKQSLPRDWIIWFDDPDISDVIDIERHDTKKWGDVEAGKTPKGMCRIDGRLYFKRDQRQSLGWAFGGKHRCVYTTTEIVTKQAIERVLRVRQEYILVHDKMEGISGGRITVLGTDKVYKCNDGIVPLLARRLTKMGLPVRLIADGLSQELNHSNSKGKNTLAESDILVELSVPHPSEVQTICDALGQDWKTKGQGVRREMMLDRMHQAIGRNSGYRAKGKECVVLADKSVHKWLKNETRYLLDMQNSVVIDRTAAMSRNDRRTTATASALVVEIEKFLNNLDDYVQDGRKPGNDIKFVMGAITHPSKRLTYAARLLAALTSLSGVRFDGRGRKTGQPRAHQLAYQRVGEHVLAKWVPATMQERVLKEYREIVGDPGIRAD